MKIKTIIVAAFASLAIAACAQNSSEPASLAALKPSKAQVDTVSYLLGIEFGSFIKSYDFGDDFNYNEMLKGIKDFVNAEGNQQDEGFTEQFKINPEQMTPIFNAFLAQIKEYKGAIGAKKGEEFLENNKKQEGVAVTESGLQYIIIDKGNDLKPGPEDMVEVKYSGKFIDGSTFDESMEDTIEFPLNGVIPGWSEGLQLIGEGGKIKLFIPSDLGYGEMGSGPIGPNEVLVFDVELIKVTPAAKDDAE